MGKSLRGNRFCSTHVIWVQGGDGESKHGEDFHVNEIAAVGETRKRSKGGPGEEIIDKTSIALEGDGTALSSIK